MQGLPRFESEDLLVGADHFSDAGVYRIAPDQAIVQSVDFFPPVVDDPFTYGQIAAANSMSDVYAMGGRPLTALNVVAFPDDKLDITVLQDIMRGGAERVQAAGAVVVGGHSVREPGIQFGMCVTGVVHPDRMMTNRDAEPGNVLVLTKALGTGFISTAYRAGRCPDDVLAAACESMTTLNDVASRHAVELGAKAATDITGFGLAGHAFEMAEASDVTIVLQLSTLPPLPGAETLAAAGNLSRSNNTNQSHVDHAARYEAQKTHPRMGFLFDPQTSGGLLIAIAADKADELVQRCRDDGLSHTCIVGSVVTKKDHASLVIGE